MSVTEELENFSESENGAVRSNCTSYTNSEDEESHSKEEEEYEGTSERYSYHNDNDKLCYESTEYGEAKNESNVKSSQEYEQKRKAKSQDDIMSRKYPSTIHQSYHAKDNYVYVQEPLWEEYMESFKNKTVDEKLESYLSSKHRKGYHLKKTFHVRRHDSSARSIFERGHERHIALLSVIRQFNGPCDLKLSHYENNFAKPSGKADYSILVRCRQSSCKLEQKIVYFQGKETKEDFDTVYLLEKKQANKDHHLSKRQADQEERRARN
jgi:hypothetical protein